MSIQKYFWNKIGWACFFFIWEQEHIILFIIEYNCFVLPVEKYKSLFDLYFLTKPLPLIKVGELLDYLKGK